MSLLGVDDAAEELAVSPRRVRQLLASGQLPEQRVGRSWAIDRADIRQLRRSGAGRPWSAASAWAALHLAAGRAWSRRLLERQATLSDAALAAGSTRLNWNPGGILAECGVTWGIPTRRCESEIFEALISRFHP